MATRPNTPAQPPAVGPGERRRDDRDREVAHDEGARAKDREPQPDHSEREGGGDQDIDTAGLVPGNMATDDGKGDEK